VRRARTSASSERPRHCAWKLTWFISEIVCSVFCIAVTL
jgi:hypothetical protein